MFNLNNRLLILNFFFYYFFYITCFANTYLIFYSTVFFFLIILLTAISFKKKIINIKYFLLLNLLLFVICLPNIVISLSNMLNSNAYFISNEININRKLNFVSYLFNDSLICKIIYLLFVHNIALNFKTYLRKHNNSVSDYYFQVLFLAYYI